MTLYGLSILYFQILISYKIKFLKCYNNNIQEVMLIMVIIWTQWVLEG
jgi:hypothetical protein